MMTFRKQLYSPVWFCRPGAAAWCALLNSHGTSSCSSLCGADGAVATSRKLACRALAGVKNLMPHPYNALQLL